jgi:hypothetical protein
MRRGPLKPLDERRARWRGVDDDDAAGKRADQRGPFPEIHVRPDQVELRIDAVERAVADQEHEQQVVGPGLTADRGERSPHVCRSRRLRGIGRFRQRDDARGIDLQALDERHCQGFGPRRVLLGVRLAPGRARNDHRVAILSGRETRNEQ